MSVNLLELFTNGLGKDFGGLAATALGESSGATQSAMGSILPTLLSGLMKSGGSASGASNLLSMLNGPQVNSGLLDNVAGLFSGGQAQNPLMAAGGPLLSMLFGGDKLGGIASAVASLAGIKSGSATSLMTMAAPLVFGMLKKHVSGNNMNASGLQSLLAGQSAHLGGGKLNDSILSAAGLGSAASFLTGLGGSAMNAAGNVASSAAAGTAAAATAATAAGKGLFGKLLPWLIAAAVGLFLLTQLKNCGAPKTAEAPKPAAPAAPVAASPAPVPAPAAPTATPAPMPAAVASAPDLLKVFFDSGSVAIPAGFGEKIQAFADYAKTSANTKIGISGYHDKQGNAEQNAELSKNRAKAVRDALVKGGVPEDRIMLKKPEETTGAADDKEARRVEVFVMQ